MRNFSHWAQARSLIDERAYVGTPTAHAPRTDDPAQIELERLIAKRSFRILTSSREVAQRTHVFVQEV